MPVTVAAPPGAKWLYDEVRTNNGQVSLGEVPLLEWEEVDGMIAFFGKAGVLQLANGTSSWVSYQGIARRMKRAGKSDDEIAEAELKFRPGERQVGASTPESRARRAAGSAAEKIGGDTIVELLSSLEAMSEEERAEVLALLRK